MTSPSAELRKAAAFLRCDHEYPCAEPYSWGQPGPCRKCGKPYNEATVSKPLREPLAGVLEEAAELYDWTVDSTDERVRPKIEPNARAVVEPELAVARAINGDSQ